MGQLIKMIKKNERKILFIFNMIGILFIFCTMLYQDNLANSNFGYQIIDSVFTGTFKELYNASSWSYGISIYAIYAVWSIPIWILFHITGIPVDMNYIPVLLWYKLLLCIFAVWSIHIIAKIAIELQEEKKDIVMQYIASYFFIFPVLAIAQCDIIGLCFALLGVYYYVKNENKKFVIFFAIAITMKYFAVIIFIPLVLFRFRKLRKCFCILVIGIALMLISSIIIHSSDRGQAAWQEDSYYVNEHIRNLSMTVIETDGSGTIGLFGLFYSLLCVVAYILPNQEIEKNKDLAIWLVLAGYMCFFMFYPANEYWYVLLAPFLILISYLKPKYIKINLILITLFEITIAIYGFYSSDWVILGENTFSYLFLRKYGQAMNQNAFIYTMSNLFHFEMKAHLAFVRGISYACAISIMTINFPNGQKEQQSPEDEKEIKLITWFRVVVIYMWIIIAIYCLISSQNDYYFKDSAVINFEEDGIMSSNCEHTQNVILVEDGAWMSEEFTIMIYIKENMKKDIQLNTFGYTSANDLPVYVYVNDQLIGELEKEDASVNITNRRIAISKEYLNSDVTQKIKLVAEPASQLNGNIPISLFMEELTILAVE